ncbi:GGDEF domain-containing protein [Pseudomonas sp. MF6394]|uniref:GGDEF domain-containing protein n=1 Tax=Pseudomonas sp. MF6394 TaxID=1960829 RepID=UPI0023799DEF|nr:GGDEF domain-containing protein [Pseudomonas sp. MF6394]
MDLGAGSRPLAGWRGQATDSRHSARHLFSQGNGAAVAAYGDHRPLDRLVEPAGFNERLQLEWERLKRSTEIQAALVLCDIDHFKRINDTYGHGCSDEVLKHFASRLREHVRATDMAARIGGEEFAVLLEAASIEDAQVWAERFRQDAAATAVVCGEVSISYSASMGGGSP